MDFALASVEEAMRDERIYLRSSAGSRGAHPGYMDDAAWYKGGEGGEVRDNLSRPRASIVGALDTARNRRQHATGLSRKRPASRMFGLTRLVSRSQSVCRLAVSSAFSENGVLLMDGEMRQWHNDLRSGSAMAIDKMQWTHRFLAVGFFSNAPLEVHVQNGPANTLNRISL